MKNHIEGKRDYEKGKSYGKRTFHTPQIQEKDINEIAEDYYNLCSIRGTSEITIKGYKHALKYFMLQRGTGHSTLKQLNTYYNASTKDIASIIDDIAPKSQSKKK